jgi:nucleoside-diphosphate-sugar epimerase
MQRLLVLGGNGYVGQNICRAALDSGKFSVASLSRSGRPTNPGPCLANNAEMMDKVEWLEGDIFDSQRRDETFEGVDVIVSTIGAFGSNNFMERVCGDATVEAVDTAVKHKVSRFGFVSSAQVGGSMKFPPSFPLYGYFKGKEKAESAIQEAFPDAHAILRPGFVYGPRMAGAIGPLPLHLIGAPVSFISTQLGPVSSLIQSIPFVGTECGSMVPVHAVSKAMVRGVSVEASKGLILSASEIRKYSKLDPQ